MPEAKIVSLATDGTLIRYERNSWIQAGTDDFTLPPAQNPDMFLKLSNILPPATNVLLRRFGYQYFDPKLDTGAGIDDDEEPGGPVPPGPAIRQFNLFTGNYNSAVSPFTLAYLHNVLAGSELIAFFYIAPGSALTGATTTSQGDTVTAISGTGTGNVLFGNAVLVANGGATTWRQPLTSSGTISISAAIIEVVNTSGAPPIHANINKQATATSQTSNSITSSNGDIGLAFSASGMTLTLTSVANASAGSTVYTGTITGGGSNRYVGANFIIAGFTTSANNGTFACTASTATTLTLSNGSGVAETHAATAASGTTAVTYTPSGTFGLATSTLSSSAPQLNDGGPNSCVLLSAVSLTGGSHSASVTSSEDISYDFGIVSFQ